MSPEAMQAALLQAAETRMEGLLKVEREHIAALRQLIAKGLKAPEPEAQP
ncbi:hypothetical protein [Geothrix campi]|nr:hypothetical protein [Geothrix sp. SG10]